VDADAATYWLGWLRVAQLVAVFLVAIGVAAEFAGEWISRPLEKIVNDARELQIAQLTARTAEAEKATESQRRENISLQKAMIDRHIGLIGFNETPRSKVYFVGIDKFSGTDVLIQSVNDPEAKSFAAELALVLTVYGWKPQLIDEKRSHLVPELIHESIAVSYPTGKPWTEQEPVQPWFTWHDAAEALADALTKAGLGVLDLPVPRFGFTNEPNNKSVGLAYFEPPLTGVYVQVGPRPISMTVQILEQRRKEAESAAKH
jgi:hypothetical protein